MNITPIASTAPACFGVGCGYHGSCTRYSAVDGSSANPSTIGTCVRGGEYPLYRAKVSTGAAAHAEVLELEAAS